MKISRSAAGVLPLALALAFSTSAAAAPAKKRAPAKAAPVAAKAAPFNGEIELVHELGADKGAELEKLVERFNAANPGGKIKLTERKWSEGELPELMILGEESEAQLLAHNRYKPLNVVMKEAGEPLETLKPPAMMSPAPLDAAGKVIGLPVGLGTPIMYFNKDVFRKHGLDPNAPPKTWAELQNALGVLADKGVACPYTSTQPAWVHVENISAWHNQPVAQTAGKREVFSANGLVQVKHLAMMKTWVKARYFHVFGYGTDAEQHFASGECAVLTASSNAYPSLHRGAKFEIGVSTLPYHDDVPGSPQNTLADGPILWVGAGKSAPEYKLAAKFVSFMLTPENQVEMEVNLGGLPVNRAGLLASGSTLLKQDLVAVRTAISQLADRPTTAASRATRVGHDGATRRVLAEELDELWAGKQPAKAAIDQAVERLRGGR